MQERIQKDSSSQENQSNQVTSQDASGFPFTDNRQVKDQLQAVQRMANNHVNQRNTVQLKSNSSGYIPAGAKNNTGLPDTLKSGIEHLSGYSMDDVKVHYNSSKPAQLNAYAYAQGTQIHVAPGQEKHIGHEAWHVVQQKQGRVQPTKQLKEKVAINDDAGLEHEADVMGEKAMQFKADHHRGEASSPSRRPDATNVQLAVVQGKIIPNSFNVVGELHDKSGKRRGKEKEFTSKLVGGSYWGEDDLRVELAGQGALAKMAKLARLQETGVVGDPFVLRFLQSLIFTETEANNPGQTYLTLDQWVDQLKTLYSRAENKSDGEDMSEGAMLKLTQFSVVFEDWSKLNGAALSAKVKQVIKPIIAEWSEVCTKENIVRNETRVVTSHLGAENKEIDPTETTSQVRSVAMHHSAVESQNSKKIGVWKVGQNHADHMKKMAGRNYSITDHDEFYQELNAYYTAKSKAEDPTQAVNELRKKNERIESAERARKKEYNESWQAYLKSDYLRKLKEDIRRRASQASAAASAAIDESDEIQKGFFRWRHLGDEPDSPVSAFDFDEQAPDPKNAAHGSAAAAYEAMLANQVPEDEEELPGSAADAYAKMAAAKDDEEEL